MKIMMIVCSIAYLISVTVQVIYGMHMFQLNGYKEKIHLKWINMNRNKFASCILIFIWSMVVVFFCNFITLGILILFMVLNSFYFISLEKKKAKKKLVYTKRVQRMFITLVLLSAVIIVVAFLVPSYVAGGFLLGLMASVVPFEIVLSNFINKPVEAGVNRHFINDAKKMLQSSPDLCVIGVTGSYGKTSVKFYLDALLRTKYNVLTTPESYNTPMGVVKTIREHLNPMHEIFICEMGAKNIGDIKELCDIVHPTHGIITSIGPQHLESFLNIENVLKTKYELADSLKENGSLFLNYDNEYITGYKKYSNTISYSTQASETGYYGEIKNVTRKGTVFEVTAPSGESREFTTKLIGNHNVINVMGAIAVANTLNIPLEDLILPVRKLTPVEHRLQLIERNNLTIIDDAYNSNPVGAKAALDTLAMFSETKILVTPGMIELGTKENDYNYAFGKQAAAVCDNIILVGKKQTESIAKGVLDAGFNSGRLYIADSLQDAMNHAYTVASEDRKIILLENDLPDNY